MNDLYGVDPAAPSTPGELIALLRMFGPTEGRFIAQFPLGWEEAAAGILADAKPLERRHAQEWILRRRRAFVEVQMPYVAAMRWEENAIALTAIVRGLIGTRGCAATATAIDVALMDPDAIPDSRGGQVPRTISAYLGAAWPLLATCSKVVLVDPYFRLRLPESLASGKPRAARRQRQFLVDLLADAQRRRKVEVFVLYVSSEQALARDPDGAAFEEDLASVLDDAQVTGIDVQYDLLDEVGDTRQHARYLLGQGCGLQFDHGFDTGDGTNHVHWLSTAELAPLLKKFDLPDG